MTIVSDYTAILACLGRAALRWNAAFPFGTAVTLTYSLADAAHLPTIAEYDPYDAEAYHSLTEPQAQNFHAVLDLVSAAAGITFVEVDTAPMIRVFGASGSSYGGWAEFAYSTETVLGASNVVIDDEGDFDPGSYAFFTMIHELGHALGLKHPFEGPVSLERAMDSTDYTVMSYNAAFADGYADSLGPLDVEALQHLYGAAQDTSGWVIRVSPELARLVGGAGDDRITGLGSENRLDGGDGNDMLTGRWLSDTLSGGTGDDTLDGSLGDDTLLGGDGADWINGGDGNDLIWGDNRADGDDSSGAMDRIWGGAGNDRIWGQRGTDQIWGEGDDDLLRGGRGHDQLYGGAGNDTLRGDEPTTGAGRDLLMGGAGDDLLRGAAGDDTLFGEDGDDRLLGDADADWLDGGNGEDRLYGGGDADTLIGGADRDLLFGGGGSDRIEGGGGADALFGGGGADLFIFGLDASGARDALRDFEDGLDRIDVTAWGYSAGDLLVQATAAGALALLGAAEGLRILIADVDAGLITAEDFLF